MKASNASKKSKFWPVLVPAIIIVVLSSNAAAGCTVLGKEARVLTLALSEPLGDATAARFEINTGTGNLAIDRLPDGEQLLASGALEYLEGQDLPASTVSSENGLAILTIKASGGQAGFRLPWAASNGATTWQIQLNPGLPSDITACSGGGNLKLNLAGMLLTSLLADTSGGNVEVVLPDGAAGLNVTAKSGGGSVSVVAGSNMTGSNTIIATSGGGSVVVRLPGGIAALIHASTGAGKLAIDPQFVKIDDHTYQSPGYAGAAVKIEITVESGAGNVSVITN